MATPDHESDALLMEDYSHDDQQYGATETSSLLERENGPAPLKKGESKLERYMLRASEGLGKPGSIRGSTTTLMTSVCSPQAPVVVHRPSLIRTLSIRSKPTQSGFTFFFASLCL